MRFSELARWFCAIAEAWSRGEADWAYVDGKSAAVYVWNELGDEGFVAWASGRGISLKKRSGK